MAFTHQKDMSLAQELEALKVALAYMVQLHGTATPDWKAAKVTIPEQMFTKPPKVEFARDPVSLGWIVYSELPKG